jgi:hypothetical protein
MIHHFEKFHLAFANPKLLAHLERFEAGTLYTIQTVAKYWGFSYAL